VSGEARAQNAGPSSLGGRCSSRPYDDLCGYLRELAEQSELEAAHSREFIPDGCPGSPVLRYAFDAAVASGYAIALRHVLELLEP